MNHEKALETNQILKKEAGAAGLKAEAGKELHNSQDPCHN